MSNTLQFSSTAKPFFRSDLEFMLVNGRLNGDMKNMEEAFRFILTEVLPEHGVLVTKADAPELTPENNGFKLPSV